MSIRRRSAETVIRRADRQDITAAIQCLPAALPEAVIITVQVIASASLSRPAALKPLCYHVAYAPPAHAPVAENSVFFRGSAHEALDRHIRRYVFEKHHCAVSVFFRRNYGKLAGFVPARKLGALLYIKRMKLYLL